MKREIIKTADGSTTLFIPELDENYHSIHGAVQESMHVFINAGLREVKKESIRIFEMGYGTGLNFLLTYLNQDGKTIDYHGIEAFPLEQELVDQLNFVETMHLTKDLATVFDLFHTIDAHEKLSSNFSLTKSTIKLSAYTPPCNFDLIYFDAFAPEVQPELWTSDIFHKLFNITNPKGILTTYCAKGQVRRNMQTAGFRVERLPGPPGKREMLRARKPA